MAVKYRPVGNRVLVRLMDKTGVTKAGIYLPDVTKENHPNSAEILAVGDCCIFPHPVRIDLKLAVGDIVIFGEGAAVDPNDKKLLLVDVSSIYCVIE